MKISVIIPSYKPQSYLWECLDSLCGQTFPKTDFEVILVLNGCCEPYNGLIKEYISNHLEIQWNYIQTDQGGVSNARNRALDVARGEYVTFIDDDDYVSNNYLKSLYEKAFDNRIVIACPYAFNDGDNEEIDYRITDEYKRLAAKGIQKASNARKFFSGPWMKLIPMIFIQDRRFNPKFKLGEDSLFMFSISDKFKNVDFADKSVRYYRRYRDNSAITNKKTLGFLIANAAKMCMEYTKLYFGHWGKYSFKRYILAMLGAFKGVIANI